MARRRDSYMSLLTWLVGVFLAPVFMLIGLGVLIISGLFDDEGIDWDE